MWSPAASYSLDQASYTGIITAGSRGGNLDVAEGLMDEMRFEGIPPNVATYNAAISGCAGGGEWRRALRLLDLMREDPHPEAVPQALTYTLVIKACDKDGKWELALELLDEMQVCFSEDSGKICPIRDSPLLDPCQVRLRSTEILIDSVEHLLDLRKPQT